MSGRAARAVRGLTVRGLRVEADSGVALLDGLDLDVPRGRVLGVVGEPGAGKTTAGLALLGHARRGTRITAGSVELYGTDVLALSERERRTWRGRRIAYVAPHAAGLDPAMRVGRQVLEALAVHGALGSAHARDDRVAEVLAEAGLPADQDFLARRPDELTAAERHRVALATAFACRPALVVLDDPVAGLDGTAAAALLGTVRALAGRHGSGALYLGRDLAVVAAVADEVAVLYAGGLVETAAAGTLVAAPRHPYTARLLASVPDLRGRRRLGGAPGAAPDPARRPMGCRFAPRCPLQGPECVLRLPEPVEVRPGHLVRCVHHDRVGPATTPWDGVVPAPARTGVPLLTVDALTGPGLHGVGLALEAATCVALLGGPDAGGTAVTAAIAGRLPRAHGVLTLHDEPLPVRAADRTPTQLRAVATFFPDPATALDPRRTVGASVARPFAGPAREGVRVDVRAAVVRALDRAGLPAATAERYPAQLTSEERWLASLARALVTGPDVLVCADPAAGRPATAVVNLVERLTALRADGGPAILVATGDVALVRHLATHVAVLDGGRAVEHGSADRVLGAPAAPPTRELLAAVPSLAPA